MYFIFRTIKRSVFAEYFRTKMSFICINNPCNHIRKHGYMSHSRDFIRLIATNLFFLQAVFNGLIAFNCSMIT